MSTKQAPANQRFVPGTSRTPRSLETFALQVVELARQAEVARNEDTRDPRKVEMGQRIKQLREPMPQQRVIDKAGLDITLRAYQAWEAGDSGISWDKLERLADFFGVSPEYLLSGAERRVSPDQLDRIEAKLDELLTRLDAGEALRVAEDAERLLDKPAARRRRTG